MQINIVKNNNTTILKIEGNIDEQESENFKKRYREIKISSDSIIVLDFEKVTHIGSSCLGKLLLLYKDVRVSGGKLELINANKEIFEILKVVDFHKMFLISKI